MTTILNSATTLNTLMAVYEHENAKTGGKLTSDQVSNLENLISGSTTDPTPQTDSLTGTSDLSSIIDAMNAKAAGTTTNTNTDTNATPQQKAATLMQNIYQSQQSNLFTLIG